MIRKMELRDIEEIKKIDKVCFKIDVERTTEGIRGYMQASNNSSIVYEVNNKVVGFNFIHIWGSFGWFGPFGVHTEYQGKGIGKVLINETIRILKEDYKVSTIGLNTMPESQYNVGFYMNLDFTPLKLSLSMKRQLDFTSKEDSIESNKYDINDIDISNEGNYLTIKENLKSLSNKIHMGFDLASELNLIREESFGTILTLKSYGEIHGIVICYTKAVRDFSSKNLQIKLAIIDNKIDYKEAIDSIMHFCTRYAKKINYESISIDCNTYNKEICNYLMENHKFKIDKTQVMMLMGEVNPFESKGTLLLTRLAG
ncbi:MULTISPECIES: N-acetyltransferase [unclassified Clostridium]|uniref:GNAT family N-acetyltransferase n=1 Tax=unclassified Clostridium TaxID=2614128 RepID=UPI000297E176|nr:MULTISPECIES: N-acetyltransferase [unclassified Clostridium]EKQ55577.1 MAG: putative acetyltransferase [Clostridium sp. Maddingley MBC34-26]